MSRPQPPNTLSFCFSPSARVSARPQAKRKLPTHSLSVSLLRSRAVLIRMRSLCLPNLLTLTPLASSRPPLHSAPTRLSPLSLSKKMPTIVEGVDFDTIAREWRCKWDGADESKASLAAAQALIATHLATIKAVPGVTSVQRFVCGGCFDFKIVTSVAEPSYGAWAGADHSPEKEVSFLYRMTGFWDPPL